MYIAVVKPFKDRSLYTVELINELLLLVSSYTPFYSSDYNNQNGFHEFKYNVGWIMIGIIVTLIFYNVLVISKKVIRDFKQKLRSRKAAAINRSGQVYKYNI